MVALRALVIAVATALAVVLFPSSALGETAGVSGGVLHYAASAGTVDTVKLTGGAGSVVISETTSPSGSLGAGCTTQSATSASCTGATSVSIQTLDLDDAIVNASSLGGTLSAGFGNDTVTGGAPAESILGGDGGDTITPGGGVDSVDAGAGDDRLDTRDGLPERIDCGAGSDSVHADQADVVTNCEIVAVPLGADPPVVDAEPAVTQRTTVDPPADAPISTPTLLEPVTLAGPVAAAIVEGTEVSVGGKGLAPFVLGCDAGEAADCTGSVFVDPAPAPKRSRGKAKRASARAFIARRGRYGHSPFRIKPGSEDKVDVKLTGMALKALGKPRGRRARSARRGRRVKAVVTIAPRRSRAQRVRITLKG